jgi:hypothetical protein
MPVGEVLLTGNMRCLFTLYYATANGRPLSVVSLLPHASHLELNTPLANALCNLSNFSPTSYASRRAAEIIHCDKNW